MSHIASRASFRRRASFSYWQILRLGAALAAALLLPLAAANAFPASSVVCSPSPSPYTAGDLTCTNAGTITTSVIDGIDTFATGGNATTTNSGTVNTSGGNIKRGWCKVVGIVKTSLLIACAVAATNIALLRTWAERTGYTDDPLCLVDPPDFGFEELTGEEAATPANGPPLAA